MLDVGPSARANCGEVEAVPFGEERRFLGAEAVWGCLTFGQSRVLAPAAVAFLDGLDCRGEEELAEVMRHW